ncbi:MAG TPA: signal peptidase I [Thermoguttaceae bacterium]|nr:signal peptidase I [Thermoguttaceae bacterium]
MAKPSNKKRSGDQRRSDSVAQAAEGAVERAASDKPPWRFQAIFREFIEAIAVAFILAFLVRTFEAEAFVIPTGSMATTLMGRHKDVECPICRYPYQVSASNGLDSRTGEIVAGADVHACICPMCGYVKTKVSGEPSFSGDRILVNKYVYCFEDPKRWDVAVFKYPEEARTNFIKRVVGLPHETIKIHHGDLFVRKDGENDFSIARKPPAKLRAMLNVVHDNDYELAEKLLAQGWPARWQAEDARGGWVAADDHKSFSNEGASDAEAWLRYRHFVPIAEVWTAIGKGRLPPDYQPAAQLITDSCSYNAGIDGRPPTTALSAAGLHWVGDLAVSSTVDVRGTKGQLIFELVEGGLRMQCRIDVATGRAELTISGDAFRRTGNTPVSRPGTYDVLFANVDDQLRLWVNGRLVEFDGPTTYEPLENTVPQEADLAPVGIATVGTDVRISHVKVLRDIYYIAAQSVDAMGLMCDYLLPYRYFGTPLTASGIREFFSNSSQWSEAFSDRSMRSVELPLDKDQFLMFGDNSAQSKDSRLWEGQHYVDRELLVGKALFIYWPHSWNKIWVGKTEITFPFFPNFKRMGLVR